MTTLHDLQSADARNDYCNEALDRAQAHAERGETDMALAIMAALAKEVDEVSEATIRELGDGRYFSFASLVQILLYVDRQETPENVTDIGFPAATVYHYYGVLLVEADRLTEALAMLEKALRWNPMNFATLMEHAEVHKMMGDLDTLREETMQALDLAMTPEELARAYRNLAFDLAEREVWADALGMLVLSLRYAPEHPMTLSEIQYVLGMADDPDLAPTEPKILHQKYQVPLLPKPETLLPIKAQAMAAAEVGQEDLAAYFESVLAPWSFLWEEDEAADR